MNMGYAHININTRYQFDPFFFLLILFKTYVDSLRKSDKWDENEDNYIIFVLSSLQ